MGAWVSTPVPPDGGAEEQASSGIFPPTGSWKWGMQPHEGHPTAGGQEREGKSQGLLHTEGIWRDRTLNVQDRDAGMGCVGWTRLGQHTGEPGRRNHGRFLFCLAEFPNV